MTGSELSQRVSGFTPELGSNFQLFRFQSVQLFPHESHMFDVLHRRVALLLARGVIWSPCTVDCSRPGGLCNYYYKL